MTTYIEKLVALGGFKEENWEWADGTPAGTVCVAQESQLAALVAAEVAEAERKLAEAQAFLAKIAKQAPEKPDYWSSCGQCQHNSDYAEDILSGDRSSLDAAIAAAVAPYKADAERYRFVRDYNGYNLNNDADCGKWRLSRKQGRGEAFYFYEDRLDGQIDADIAALAKQGEQS